MTSLRSKVFHSATLVFLFLLLVTAIPFFTHVRKGPPRDWLVHTFSGKIVELASTTISVAQVSGEKQVYALTPQTRVMEGRWQVALTDLAVGEYVLVRHNAATSGYEEALQVRIFTTDSFSR